MNYKKKSFIISIVFITLLQILLLINNRQKTFFRFFTWNIQNITIGKLICISFISGLTASVVVNKTIHIDSRTSTSNEVDDEDGYETNAENNYSINNEDNDESYDIPPERDLRDAQPTISVNYRVIKDNGEKDLINVKKRKKNTQYEDDWENNNFEW
tara:strand:+ start:592 stop:1062 length:471 start_codon:yes stop_codon:yes gene_type:complete